MSDLRDLNQQHPFAVLMSALNNINPHNPASAAYNPEARDRGPPAGNRDEQTPTTSDEEAAAPQPAPEHHDHHAHHDHHEHRRGRGGFGGGRGRGGWGGRGGWRGGPPPWAGGAAPWAGMSGPGGFDMSRLGEFISQFVPEGQRPRGATDSSTGGKDFAPDADIFDTTEAFVVHVSLPGAKKEDVGVNWNDDQSELNVAGVIYRPGSEEFLKTLALDERKVGVFERKIKLGSREKPALIDSDRVSAKMEDGVLIITIPKTEKPVVETKKVAIE